MVKEWLTSRITIEEAESAHAVENEELGPDPVHFGYVNAHWKRFLSQMVPGDELWEFSSPAKSWEHLAGRAGIALVRDGEIVDTIVTLMN